MARLLGEEEEEEQSVASRWDALCPRGRARAWSHAQVCERAESSEGVLRDGANLVVLDETVEGTQCEGGAPRGATGYGRCGILSPKKLPQPQEGAYFLRSWWLWRPQPASPSPPPSVPTPASPVIPTAITVTHASFTSTSPSLVIFVDLEVQKGEWHIVVSGQSHCFQEPDPPAR